MFIDYLSVMLINMAAGLVMLAGLIYQGFNPVVAKKWAPGFALVGLVGLITSIPVVISWPLPGAFNIAYGETSLMFSALWLVAAFSLAFNWDLMSLTIYAFFAGIVSIIIGVGFLQLKLSLSPEMAAAGYFITGFGAIMAFPTYVYFKDNIRWRIFGALVILLAAALWGVTGFGAYWGHLSGFAKWTPQTMLIPTPPPK